MGVWVGIVVFLAGAGVAFGIAALGRQRNKHHANAGLSEIDLQAIFDHVTDGVVVVDIDRNIVLMNRSAAKLLGMEQRAYTAAVVSDAFELFTSEGEPIPRDLWPSARALRGDFLQECELRIRRVDTGAVSIARITTAPVKDDAGKLVQVLVLYTDLTERKEFDTTRNRLVAIVESSEDAIVGKDERGFVTTWNRGAEKIFGYTAAEIVGESIKILLPMEREHEEDEILARIHRGETVDHLETMRLRKDGSEILVSMTISPIRDASGRIVGASKVARDITAQRRMERQMQQSQKMEAIGQLTGGIAHDFNNLLGVVIGNLDLMTSLVGDNEAALKRLQTAHKAAARGADLTRRMLAFSSRQDLHPTWINLAHSIRNTLELAQRALGPEIKIVAQLEKSVPEVMVDRAGLETLLLNLMLNARDAMPEGGTLTVSTQLTNIDKDYPPVQAGELKIGQYVRTTVSDTGHGMSRETLDRVFEPFFTTKPRGRGTGLGLATAYGLVKQSGGTVRIYSELGYGTSVSFFLPVLAHPDESQAAERGAATARGASSGTVLLVDDEEDLLEIAAAYVEEMGCTALRANDGASALALLDAGLPVDVMITDIIMPGGISGAMLAQRARELRPSLKIIYCSGFPADALAERTSLLLDGPLLRKPYQRAEIHALVARVLAELEAAGDTPT